MSAGAIGAVATGLTVLTVGVSRFLINFNRARRPAGRGGGQIYTGDPSHGYHLVQAGEDKPLEHHPEYWAPQDQPALDPEGVIDTTDI
jgi:hypothetical protein